MISSDVQNYLKSLIKTYSEQGYYNYLAHSYTRRYNEQEYNLVVYLSKDDITNSSLYTFNVSGDSLVLYLNTSSYYDSEYPAIKVQKYNGGRVDISNYETVLTNSTSTAVTVQQVDIMQERGLTNETFLAVSIALGVAVVVYAINGIWSKFFGIK